MKKKLVSIIDSCLQCKEWLRRGPVHHHCGHPKAPRIKNEVGMILDGIESIHHNCPLEDVVHNEIV